MKIAARGKTWAVPNPGAVMTGPQKFILGCERCASTCCTPDPCACCRAYKTRSAGSSVVYFPRDGKGHLQIMSMTAFRQIFASELAAQC